MRHSRIGGTLLVVVAGTQSVQREYFSPALRSNELAERGQ